ncbi:MAG: hypothetical protein V3V50_07350 [Gammaproteobacteria bacterium]
MKGSSNGELPTFSFRHMLRETIKKVIAHKYPNVQTLGKSNIDCLVDKVMYDMYIGKMRGDISLTELIESIDATISGSAFQKLLIQNIAVKLGFVPFLGILFQSINHKENRPFKNAPAPPVNAQKLLLIFLNKEDRQTIPGDLEEEFHTVIFPKHGERFALRWYWWQAFRSIWQRFCSRLVKWAAVAWFGKVAAWLTSKLGS